MATPSAERLCFPTLLPAPWGVLGFFFRPFFSPCFPTRALSQGGSRLAAGSADQGLTRVFVRFPLCSTARGHQGDITGRTPLGSSHQPHGGVMVPCPVRQNTSFGSRALCPRGPHTPLTLPPLPWETLSPSASSALMPPNTSPLQRAGTEFLGSRPTGRVLPWDADLAGEALCRVMVFLCWGQVR